MAMPVRKIFEYCPKIINETGDFSLFDMSPWMLMREAYKLERSDIRVKIKALRAAIEKEDADQMATLLQEDFIYRSQVKRHYVPHENDPLGGTYEYERLTFKRPLIEKIYMNCPTAFDDLLELLQHHKKLRSQFLHTWHSLKEDPLCDLSSSLFQRDDEALNNAKTHLATMKKDGRQLEQSTDAVNHRKGLHIKTLCAKIHDSLSSLEEKYDAFEIAQLKRSMLREILNHGYLGHHRHSMWLRSVANFSAALLGGPIPFILNKVINGHFFFGMQTRSRRHVLSIQEALDPKRKISLTLRGA